MRAEWCNRFVCSKLVVQSLSFGYLAAFLPHGPRRENIIQKKCHGPMVPYLVKTMLEHALCGHPILSKTGGWESFSSRVVRTPYYTAGRESTSQRRISTFWLTLCQQSSNKQTVVGRVNTCSKSCIHIVCSHSRRAHVFCIVE